MKGTLINDNFFLLDLCTSSGTYVKEFVHGDLGRTTPNVGQILQTTCDILQLDVLNLYKSIEEAIKDFY